MTQSAWDHDEQAIAIFNGNGELEVSNAAYAMLWEDDPRERLTRDDFAQALQIWEGRCLPHLVWEELRQTMTQAQGEVRSSMSDVVWMSDGRRLNIYLTPLKSGRTMIKFRASLQKSGQRPHPHRRLSPVPRHGQRHQSQC